MIKHKKVPIESDNPLPQNTYWEASECLAKLVLEYIDSKTFYDLDILDKPDLQNKDCDLGIEVTRAIPEKVQYAEGIYRNILFGKLINDQETYMKLDNINAQISNGALCVTSFFNKNDIKEKIENKLKKLNNSEYKIFNSNYLFIYYYNVLGDDDCKELIKYSNELNKIYNKSFNKIFLYIYGGKIYELDNNNKTIKNYLLSKKEVDSFGELSRKMVIDKENEFSS